MIKFFIFLFLFTTISLKSFADQGYYLVEINCYPKSGYFEIRYYETFNLNMHTQGIMDENNLYDLSAYLQNEKNISGTCKMKSNKYVETKHSISYELKPFGNLKYKTGICMFTDASLSITYEDKKEEKKLIDELTFSNQKIDEGCSHGFGPKSGSGITNFKYIATSKYFTLLLREELERGIMKIREKTFFIDKATLPINKDSLNN